MHFSDSSKSSDSSRSSGASASVSQLLSYWQYYRRKFHLLWRALFICDHRGFTFHPSSNHHHHHHIIITSSPLSSNQHHLIIMSSPLSSLHHHIVITSLPLSSNYRHIVDKISSLNACKGRGLHPLSYPSGNSKVV